MGSGDSLPVRLLHDRLLVAEEGAAERKTSGGILIPATAQVGKRLAWARVVAVGQNVRTVEVGDRVLFDPEDSFGDRAARGDVRAAVASATSTRSPRRGSGRARPAVSVTGRHR